MGTHMKSIKHAIRADIKRRNRARKAHFDKLYNKPLIWEPNPNANMSHFFFHPKLMGHPLLSVPKAASVVYPVMCSQQHSNGEEFQLSRENIGRMAGLNPSTVDRAIDWLVSNEYTSERMPAIPLLKRRTHKSTRNILIWKAGVIPEAKNEEDKRKSDGEYFIFHTCLVKSGIWRDLTVRAKVLWLAMRTVAKFDVFEYEDEEYDGFGPHDYDWMYHRNRKYDIVPNISMARLCRMGNISNNLLKQTYDELYEYRLARPSFEHPDYEVLHGNWNVYLIPDEKKWIDKTYWDM